MGLAARRRLAVLVPWVALAAVTVFAFAQIRARHDAPAPSGVPAGPAAEPAEAPPPSGAEVRVLAEARGALEAARAAGDALDAALTDLAAARAEKAHEAAAWRDARDRAESNAAALAVAEARLEADTGSVDDQERQALLAQVEVLRERLAAREKPPLRWLADAASGDPLRRGKAREGAAGASPEDVQLLDGLLREDPERADAVALLVRHLPAGPPVVDLAVAVLTMPGGSPERVRRVGAAVLGREGVMLGLVPSASPEVVRESLKLLAGRMPELGEAERKTLRDQVEARLESLGAWPHPVTLALVAVLRLEGLAVAVAERLGDEDPATRAAAAHALSRVPDLDSVRPAAVEALPRLLMDGSYDTRIAGLHLAEALLGQKAKDYDPSAGEAVRREAVNSILDRL